MAAGMKSKIEDIDVEIQKLISEKKNNHKSINVKLDKLMEERRLLQKADMQTSGKAVDHAESEQLFGTDMSQSKQHFIDRVKKDIENYSDAIKEIENYIKHNKEMLGQNMIVKLHKVKYLREKLRLMLNDLKGTANSEWEDMRVEIESVQEEMEDSLDKPSHFL